jgi:hypothetical protein
MDVIPVSGKQRQGSSTTKGIVVGMGREQEDRLAMKLVQLELIGRGYAAHVSDARHHSKVRQ